jgi:Yersinia/Haemophilus virulence surface antigen
MPFAYAFQEYEFIQSDVAAPTSLSASELPCFALVANWPAEKKKTSNGMRGTVSRIFGGNKRDFYGPASPAQQAMFQDAMNIQRDYAQMPEEGPAARQTLDRVGLKIDEPTTDQVNHAMILVVAISLAMEQAVSHLHMGSEMMVRCQIDKEIFHAIGIYRSRGGNIHVFDPNHGVFKVTNVGEFFASLENDYISKGLFLNLDWEGEKFLYIF